MGAPDGRNLVVVVGSVNRDLVLSAARLPGPGETVGDAALEVHGGGKGANQALASALCGAPTALVGRVGADESGAERRRELADAGVDVTALASTPDAPTGLAVVLRAASGENAILVAPGANGVLTAADLAAQQALLGRASVLVCQLEVPVPAVVAAVAAVSPATCVVLNAAPARAVPAPVMARLDVLVVNEHEAVALGTAPVVDVASALRAGRLLTGRGARAVICTLGALGAVLVSAGEEGHVPAPRVRAVDTTGAGDALVGALAARLWAGAALVEALRFAVAVGSATSEHRGARARLPAALGQS